ncbi:hypothetical protein [Oscillibacter sp. 1-3]|uniref:hypothetical protein n=1 Tax=Oscillibacter sp. 1-3 TaxID=1235797 RepID=UPI000335E2B1|nr:hypothetical protein [Oscillibacter sp. 1-3]EOS63549.1 hypothetical protein C816_03323 [Oscillibacter sp. 1-3]
MDRRRALSVMGLFFAAALAFGLARWEEGRLWGTAEDRLPKPVAEPALDADEARQILRTYFMDHYSEASCSAVYTDLTHDGVEELLVLTVENSRTGESMPLHGGTLDADSFTRAQVTVLRAREGGEVLPIYEFACGAEHSQWGELYLKKEEGADYLVWYAPYTASGRGDFQAAQFFLGEDGAVLDHVRERIFFPAGDSETREGDADEGEITAFLAWAESLMKDAEPVIVFDVIHDPVAGADGPRRFAYLDALFTSF